MQLKYIGHASFIIKSKDAKLITDPFDASKVGLKFPKQEADIVTVSHQHSDHNHVSNITGDPLVIDWPGEFEKKGIRVSGFKTYHDPKKGEERGENTLYKIETEGITILHCGDLGHTLTDSIIDEIGDVDVLLIPVGGFYTITAEEAAKVIKAVEPSYAIPMHFKTDQHDPKTFSDLTDLDAFLKTYGVDRSAVEETDVLTVKSDTLPEETKIVVMKMSQ